MAHRGSRPEIGPAVDQGYFGKDTFAYDEAQDCWMWPARQRLDPFSRSEKDRHCPICYGNRQVCRDCVLKPQCTLGTDCWKSDAMLDYMAERLAARPDIRHHRRETVEQPFGLIKQWMNHGAFPMRRLASVNAEFSLAVLTYNFKRAINIKGSLPYIAPTPQPAAANMLFFEAHGGKWEKLTANEI